MSSRSSNRVRAASSRSGGGVPFSWLNANSNTNFISDLNATLTANPNTNPNSNPNPMTANANRDAQHEQKHSTPQSSSAQVQKNTNGSVQHERQSRVCDTPAPLEFGTTDFTSLEAGMFRGSGSHVVLHPSERALLHNRQHQHRPNSSCEESCGLHRLLDGFPADIYADKLTQSDGSADQFLQSIANDGVHMNCHDIDDEHFLDGLFISDELKKLSDTMDDLLLDVYGGEEKFARKKKKAVDVSEESKNIQVGCKLPSGSSSNLGSMRACSASSTDPSTVGDSCPHPSAANASFLQQQNENVVTALLSAHGFDQAVAQYEEQLENADQASLAARGVLGTLTEQRQRTTGSKPQSQRSNRAARVNMLQICDENKDEGKAQNSRAASDSVNAETDENLRKFNQNVLIIHRPSYINIIHDIYQIPALHYLMQQFIECASITRQRNELASALYRQTQLAIHRPIFSYGPFDFAPHQLLLRPSCVAQCTNTPAADMMANYSLHLPRQFYTEVHHLLPAYCRVQRLQASLVPHERERMRGAIELCDAELEMLQHRAELTNIRWRSISDLVERVQTLRGQAEEYGNLALNVLRREVEVMSDCNGCISKAIQQIQQDMDTEKRKTAKRLKRLKSLRIEAIINKSDAAIQTAIRDRDSEMTAVTNKKQTITDDRNLLLARIREGYNAFKTNDSQAQQQISESKAYADFEQSTRIYNQICSRSHQTHH